LRLIRGKERVMMKFFKHFVDSHRGQSMTILMEEMGHTGFACYWILVEMCAEKLDKGAEELFSEEHCVFEFHERVLRRNLRISRTKLEDFLNICSGISVLSFKFVEQIIEIKMPKLLDCLDRDSKRARTDRAAPAPKKKRKKEIKKESIYAHKFSELASKYKSMFPSTTIGGNAEVRFNQQILTDQDLADLETSLIHYRRALDSQEWRQPKTTFERYLGTKASGFFWREYVEMPTIAEASKPLSIADILAEEPA
jgi:hypothetical protein